MSVAPAAADQAAFASIPMYITAKQKLVYDMHVHRGLQQKEIAQLLGKTPESICRIYKRAVRNIERLQKLCGAGGAGGGADCCLAEAVLQ